MTCKSFVKLGFCLLSLSLSLSLSLCLCVLCCLCCVVLCCVVLCCVVLCCVVLCCVVLCLCCVVLCCVAWLWWWWWLWWGEGWRREGGEGETNRTIWAKVSFKIAQTEQPENHPVADSLRSVPSGLLKLNNFIRHSECLEESATCLLSTYSQTENGEDPLVSLVNL